MRTFDLDILVEATKDYQTEDFYPDAWITDIRNIALTDDDDLALFQQDGEGCYFGHYFFKSRGKKALENAHHLLDEVFTDYDIHLIKGLSPLQKLGARWMNRQLGFTSYGVIQTKAGPCELVIMTRQEWLYHKEQENK